MNDDAPEKSVTIAPPEERKEPGAWQPFTPRGVAAFAQASVARLFVLESIVAIFATIIVVWFIHANYLPSIFEAIKNIPDEAVLQNGELTNVVSTVLTEKKFLSAVIDLEQIGNTGQTADLQLQLRRDYFQVCSLFGCGLFVYPRETIYIGHSTAEPWLGARLPIILGMSAVLTILSLLLTWSLLALVYGPIAKVTAYFADRKLSLVESWRLASAAQMPGAVLMGLAILFYGWQAFDLIRFLFFFGLHFVVAWVYLFAAVYSLPPVAEVEPVKTNPFSTK